MLGSGAVSALSKRHERRARDQAGIRRASSAEERPRPSRSGRGSGCRDRVDHRCAEESGRGRLHRVRQVHDAAPRGAPGSQPPEPKPEGADSGRLGTEVLGRKLAQAGRSRRGRQRLDVADRGLPSSDFQRPPQGGLCVSWSPGPRLGFERMKVETPPATRTFADRVAEAVERKRSQLVVGLDPRLDLLPVELRGDAHVARSAAADAVARFCCGIVDAVAPYAVAVKPQLAFFEALGADGVRAFEQTCQYARSAGLLVIADAKRGDIGSTARAYAAAYLEGEIPVADAMTVNPYLGRDSLEPFFGACRRQGSGVFCLVKTSNEGGGDVQDVRLSDGGVLWQHVARLVAEWGEDLVGEHGLSSVGAVVGATHALAALPQVHARAYLVEDGQTGQVLARYHERARVPIASLTKLMTVLLTVERTKPSDVVTVAPGAASVGESSIELRPGERLTVRELLEGALI